MELRLLASEPGRGALACNLKGRPLSGGAAAITVARLRVAIRRAAAASVNRTRASRAAAAGLVRSSLPASAPHLEAATH